MPVSAAPQSDAPPPDATVAQADVATGADSLLEAVSDQFKALREAKGALGVYRRDDGAIVVVVPASGSSTFKASDTAPLGITVVVEARDIELADIAAIKEKVSASTWVPAPGVAYPAVIFDAKVGRVRIITDAPIAEFAGLIAAYPGKIDFPGRGATRLSREADYSPHWGGAKMVSPDRPGASCTSGFGVTTAGGSDRMVTASHCWWEVGWYIESPQGGWFGEVKRRDDFPTNDFELVGGLGASQGGSIYVGGSVGTRKRVAGASNPGWAETYCFSGARSFQNCGFQLVDDDFLYEDDEGITPHTMVLDGPEGNGACPGDSGSPAYKERTDGNAGIKGLVFGGDFFWPPGSEWWCDVYANTMYIEKWSKISDTYDVTIRTDA